MTNRQLTRRELLSLGTANNDADPIVHIASLLVQATQQGCAAVRVAAQHMPGSELHDTAHAGKLVIVLESADSRAIADAAHELQQLAGVLTVSIVAHMTDRASALDATDESTTVPQA